MDNNIENKKRANELIELMKNGTLSTEQLKELVPMTTDFMKDFCGALKEEIISARQGYSEAVKALEKAIDALSEIGKVEDCSNEIREAIVDRILAISDTIKGLQKDHEDKSDKRFWGVLSIIGMVAGLVFLLSSNSNNKGHAPLI